MEKVLNLLRFLLCFILCGFYSAWVAISLVIAYVFKRQTRFWEVKKRTQKPSELTNNEFGEHRFMNVNVSADESEITRQTKQQIFFRV